MSIRSMAALLCVAGLSACLTPDDHELKLADSHRKLAEMHLTRGEPELAIREYRISMKIWDRDPEAHFGLAEAYRAKGLLPDAERHLRRAVSLYPGHSEAWLNLGAVLLQQQRWPEAEQIFHTLADDPTFVRPTRALVNLGWAQYMSGQNDKARESFELAVAADRNNFVALLDLGILTQEEGDPERALEYFEACLAVLKERAAGELAGHEAQARYRLAQSYERLGRRARAISELERAEQVGGRGPWAKKSREYLEELR